MATSAAAVLLWLAGPTSTVLSAELPVKAKPAAGWVEWTAAVYYAWSKMGGTPGFGGLTITPAPAVSSYNLTMTSPDWLTGFGLSLGVRRGLAGDWFAGLSYTGIFTDGASATGSPTTDTDTVFAGLLDRSMADNRALNGLFDSGQVDAASEAIRITRHHGDLTIGRQFVLGGWFGGYWQAGLRVATIGVDRDVLYQNLEGAADLDTARIVLGSDMIGVGPTFGVATQVDLTGNGLVLRGAASASLLASSFDLSRMESQFNMSLAATGTRTVALNTFGLVPMVDASLDLTQRFGNYYLGIGYMMSAALGGARTIITTGYDDIDGNTTSNGIEKNDVINHGVYARAGIVFGPWPAAMPHAFAAPTGGGITVDGRVYYVWGGMDGTPGFGALSLGALAAGHQNFALSLGSLDETDGFGLSLAARKTMAGDWFAGLSYMGLSVNNSAAIGSPTTDTDTVFTGLLDRSLADNMALNGLFDNGRVDAASEAIRITRHHGDLTIGRQTQVGARFSSAWQAGIRVASIDVTRDIVYQNLEGAADLDTANIALRSDMFGAGPTFGIASKVDLTGNGLVLKSTTSISLLASYFDLSRMERQFNLSLATTGTRNVTLDTFGLVPMIDTSLDLTKSFGNYYLGIGYMMSAALGGARNIITAGYDDIDGATTSYGIERSDIVNYGVYARAGVMFGPRQAMPVAGSLMASNGPTVFDGRAYYLWGSMGGTPGFGTLALPTPVNGISYGLDLAALDGLSGFGLSLGAKRHFGADWYGAATYTGFFIDQTAATGNATVDTDAVFTSLLDRSMSDNMAMNGFFDSGMVDAASEAIRINRHHVDLTIGRQMHIGGWFQGAWHTGLRLASISVKRDVLYQNLEGAADLDTARIALSSDMFGTGPVLGVSTMVNVGNTGVVLKGKASAALVTGYFDLSRADAYNNLSLAATGTRSVSMESPGIVPMLDASLELSKTFGNVYLGLGYIVSAAMGGARTIITTGYDDIDGGTTSYGVEKNDIVNHGVFAKAGVKFGGTQ